MAKGLVQIVVENFDADLSSPNGKVSTHDLAIIETNSQPPTNVISNTIPRISKADMAKPISFDTEDQIVHCSGRGKPQPSHIPPHNLPAGYYEAQQISYERAGDMEFTFLKVRCLLLC